MPRPTDAPDGDEAGDGDPAPPSSRRERFTGAVTSFMLKPGDGLDNGLSHTSTGDDGPTTIPEIEAAIKRADDKERLIGLLAAPVAAAIGLLVTANLVSHDPKAIVNGQVNHLHVNPSTYVELGLVTMALALVMLGMAWFRKRLALGIATALYGLSIFNLHYWGFGIPFVMIGAWYLVRAYRLSGRLKAAKATDGVGYTSPMAPPRPSKRYTPPTSAPPRRAPKAKPGKGLEAG